MKKMLPFCLVSVLSFSVFARQAAPPDTLKKHTTLINEVVVTGQYAPQSLKNAVYQVKVISNEAIRLRAPVNVQQVLNTELGFRFSNDLTLGTADVQLMGMSGRNVKILLDGVPMVDRGDTRESLNQVDVNTVDRIEIVEGPMAVTYGSDALAGVVNIITKRPGKASFSVLAKIQEETAGTEYSFNGKGSHNQHLDISWQNRGLSASGGITRNNFGGWKIGPATSATLAAGQWLPKDQLLGNVRLGYVNSKWNVWYRLDGVREAIDSKGAMNVNNYKAKFAEYITNRYAHQLQAEWKLADGMQLSTLAGYTDLKRNTHTVIHDFSNGTEELATGAGEQDVAVFNSAIFRSTLQYSINGLISLQPGIEVTRDVASGARIKDEPVINDYAFFASAEIKLWKDAFIRPGFRIIKNSVYDAPPIIPAVNARIGITAHTDLRLGYANGFRAPALRELYYDFFDASHSIMGNPNLKAEQSHSFTASFSFSGNTAAVRWRSTLGGFYNHFTNRIDYGTSAADASITTLINIGKYKTTGATLENTISYNQVSAVIGFACTGRYNSFSEDEMQFGAMPQFVWSPELTTNLTYRFKKLGADVSLFYKFNGSRPFYELYASGASQLARLAKTGSYNLADLMVNKLVFKTLNINAGVKNLFNVTTLDSTSTSAGGAHSAGGSVPLSYGRSYVVGLTYTWASN